MSDKFQYTLREAIEKFGLTDGRLYWLFLEVEFLRKQLLEKDQVIDLLEEKIENTARRTFELDKELKSVKYDVEVLEDRLRFRQEE